MATTTPLDMISGAMRAIGAAESGEPIDPIAANDAFDMLNDMLDQWSNENMMVFQIQEIITTLTPGKYVYTLGVGGEINCTRPLNISSAFVRVATLDYPVTVIDVNQYQLIGLKTLNGPWPKAVYYNAGVPLGTATFWPNPSSGEIHLFAETVFSQFTTINDTIQFPQGYKMALRWNLAEYLLPEYGKANPVQIEMIRTNARHGKALIKRTNMQPPQVAQFDSALYTGKANDAGWVLHGGFQ